MSERIPSRFLEMLKEVWGFSELRESQQEVIEAVFQGRDLLVVMPTGGGKSLCYQAPAVYRGGCTIVISPLIALMKDQVDSLQQLGIPAVRWDSSASSLDKREIVNQLREQRIRLFFSSPERAMQSDFLELFKGNDVHTIAIDEAHCVSQWGHDFRPEYRQLAKLRESFPKAKLMALTATATERVREDIVAQLKLQDPAVMVSSFDRSNLTYRIVPQTDLVAQCREIIDRFNQMGGRSAGGIIYCMRRADVDQLSDTLKSQGYSVAAYHAGLSHEERRKAQEDFLRERVQVVVATIAFGMGIDRSNVRYVIHASLPKSMEHYQQETGRAGRDGLHAECTLLFSMRDVRSMRNIIEKSAQENSASQEWLDSQLKHLDDLVRFCKVPECRHRKIVEYFGQSYANDNCGACDVCLGTIHAVEDSKVIAQKILSCVHRMGERFGVQAIVDVLVGANGNDIQRRGHHALSTFGILKQHSRREIKDWIEQLVGTKVLQVTGDRYPVLKLGPHAKGVLFGPHVPKLVHVTQQAGDGSGRSLARFEFDRALLERLQEWRHEVAAKENVAPYVLFSDRVLAELAARRPSHLERLQGVFGLGTSQIEKYGADLIQLIQSHCGFKKVPMDQPLKFLRNETRETYLKRFLESKSLAQIASEFEITEGTVTKYLTECILAGEVQEIDAWVSADDARSIVEVSKQRGVARLTNIFEELGGRIDYNSIKIALAYDSALAASGTQVSSIEQAEQVAT